MKKIKQFIKIVGSPVLYVMVGFLLGVIVYTAHAAWNDIVYTDEVIYTSLWNNTVNKLIELDDRMYIEETTPEPSCNYTGTQVIGNGLEMTCDGSEAIEFIY